MDPRRAEKELDHLSRQFRKAHIGAPLLVAGGEDIINCFLNATPASSPAQAPTKESVEDTALDLSLSLAPTNKTIEDVDLNLSLSLPHYKQIGRDIAKSWGSSLSLAPTTQIAQDMDWGLSLSLGPTEQADPVPQPRIGSKNLRPGGPCAECGITLTPEWRRGPLGARTLCNRCGIRFGRQNQNRNRNRVN